MSDAAPFRITRYADLRGNGGHVVVENESILSSAELNRAIVPRPGPGNWVSYTSRWSKSFYVGELSDGNILNVIMEYPEDPDDPSTSLWVVVTPDGDIVAMTRTPTPSPSPTTICIGSLLFLLYLRQEGLHHDLNPQALTAGRPSRRGTMG